MSAPLGPRGVDVRPRARPVEESAAGRVRAHFLAKRQSMSTCPIPTAPGRRFGTNGRRGCRVCETCRRAAPNRVRNASLHSTLVEGIGATLATTAGASASPRRVDKRHRPHLACTINLGPWHVERMQFCAARAFVASMRKLAPAWGSPARREDLAKPLRASRLIRTSMTEPAHPVTTLLASDSIITATWRARRTLSTGRTASRCLAARAKPRRTEPRRTPRGTPRHAPWDFSIAANGARDTCQLLTERRPDSSSSRRTRGHDVAAKERTRPDVHRL